MLYLENFLPYLTDIRVYPYRIVYPRAGSEKVSMTPSQIALRER